MTNKIDKTLARLVKKKKEKAHITDMGMKKGKALQFVQKLKGK